MQNTQNNGPILLIQVREREDVAAQERACFIRRCGVEPHELTAVNVALEPSPMWATVAGARAVIIGGAAIYSVTEDQPFSGPLAEIVLRLVDADRPLFGCCWGHQFIAKVLGGTVINDPDRGETGTQRIELTPDGRRDPLFSGLTPTFLAQAGHNDRVSALPECAVELATSAACGNQAFRIAGRNIYGTQFHVELSVADLIERLTLYQGEYLAGDDALEEIKRTVEPTPETDQLLRRFLATCARR